MNTKNIELEKKIDKVTILGIESQPKEEVHAEIQETSPKKNMKKEKIDSKEKANEENKHSHPKEEKNTEKREFHPVENYHPENDRHSHSKAMRIFGVCVLSFVILLCIAFLIFTILSYFDNLPLPRKHPDFQSL